MKYLFALCILLSSAPAALAQSLDSAAATTAIAAYTPPPRSLFNDTALRTDKRATLRTDVIRTNPNSAAVFSQLAPAAGGNESLSARNDRAMRTDQNTHLRMDRSRNNSY